MFEADEVIEELAKHLYDKDGFKIAIYERDGSWNSEITSVRAHYRRMARERYDNIARNNELLRLLRDVINNRGNPVHHPIIIKTPIQRVGKLVS
jgi:hypothetical protein